VDVNFAGFLEFETDNLATLIGAINCFSYKFLDAASLYPALNFSANPASTYKCQWHYTAAFG
jgi:hypothetical protein